MKNQLWFKSFFKNIYLSTTKYISKNFPLSRFVVIKQTCSKNHVSREIAFILGPYILCSAKSKTFLNYSVKDWIKKHPNISFGKIFSKKKLKRELISQDEIKRKYKITGEISSDILETFFDIREIAVSVFCGNVFNSERDIQVSKEFISKSKSDINLFPESYPFSRRVISNGIFPSGTIFGRYGDGGPETFFIDNNLLRLSKSTAFANEKISMKRSNFPKILNYNGLKMAVIICYDLLNPRISYFLSKQNIDIVFIPSMIPKDDIKKWKKFLYVRGQEIQCPLILASNKDKRGICAKRILNYDPIKEVVSEYKNPRDFKILIGNKKIRESPRVHWSWLLKNRVFGPFPKDFN